MAKVYSVKAEPWMEDMLTRLQGELGYKKVECFRMGLRLFYKKEFPNYKKKDAVLDPRAWCKRKGGEYQEINGRPACIFQEGSGTRTKYLD